MLTDEEIGLTAVPSAGLTDADIGLGGMSDADIGLPQTRSSLEQVDGDGFHVAPNEPALQELSPFQGATAMAKHGIVDVLNTPQALGNMIFPGPHSGPQFKEGEPIFGSIPEATADNMGTILNKVIGMNLPVDQLQKAAALANIPAGFINGMTAPENAALLPFAAAKPVQAFFGADMAANSPEGTAEHLKVLQDPQSTDAEKLGAGVQGVLEPALAASVLAHSATGKPLPRKSELTQADIPGARPVDFAEAQGVIPPERGLPAPKPETRFAGGDAASPIVDVTTLSPKELVEFQRLANANKTMQERQLDDIKAKTREPWNVPIIGQETQGRNVTLPGEKMGPPQPLITEPGAGPSQRDLQGGQVSFSSEANAGAVPSALQSAEQAKTKINLGAVAPETAKDGGAQLPVGGPPSPLVEKGKDAASNPPGVENRVADQAQLPGVRGAGDQPRQGKDVPNSFSPPGETGGNSQSAEEVTPLREPPTGAVGDKDSFPPRPPAPGVGRPERYLELQKAFRYAKTPEEKVATRKALDDFYAEGKQGKQSPAAPKFSPEFKQREADKRGGFVLEAPEVVRDPKAMGFPASVRPDPTQFHNRLKNMAATGKLSPAELDVYEKAGLGEFLKGKPTVEDTAKWMEDNGPRVETKVLKSGGQYLVHDDTAVFLHELETAGFGVDIDMGENRMVLTRRGHRGPVNVNELPEDLRLRARDYLGRNREDYGHTEGFDPDTYRSIAPKDKDQTVVMVRVPVGKETGHKVNVKGERNPQGTFTEVTPTLHTGNHFGSEDRNVLGWARVQYEELPMTADEKLAAGYRTHDQVTNKVAHVIEAQSDWGAIEKVKDGPDKGKYKTEADGKIFEKFGDAQRHLKELHPLLEDYSRMALKAAIEQARKDGATHVAVSDAETAMMTEGHDLAAKVLVKMNPENLAATRKEMARIEGLPEQERRGLRYHYISLHDFVENGRDMNATAIKPELVKPFKVDTEVFQATGMTLNYSKIIPEIMEKLTGSKGERVSFGEHQRAVERDTQGHLSMDNADRYRKNLIFKNPDGSPKTDASGLLYPLPESKEPFTLFRQSYAKPTEAETGSRKMFSAATGEDFGLVARHEPRLRPIIKQLGLKDGMKAHELVGNIASAPETFGKTRASLAQFLLDNFEHVLRAANVEAGPSPAAALFGGDRTAAYLHAPHSIFLDMLSRDHLDAVDVALHEAAHAATAWQYENPKTELQRAAVKELKGLLEQAKLGLPEHVQRFLNDVYEPEMAKRKTGQAIDMDALEQKALDAGVSLPRWGGILYGLSNHQEFIGQIFSEAGFRHFLDNIQSKGQSVFARGWDAIKELLGLKGNSLLSKAFDNMAEVGAERKWGNRAADGLAGLDVMQSLTAPGTGAERSFRDKATKAVYQARGYSAPAHMAADEGVGKNLIDYASARIAAPAEGKWLATQVLGDKWKDTAFDTRLGKTLVEERLRALREQHVRNGEDDLATRVNSVMSNAEFRKALADPEIAAAIERHKVTVQDVAEKAHLEVGGKMAAKGAETGAFVNLKALLADEGDVETAKSLIYGSRKGDITNPLRRRTAFGQEAKGTGSAYELSYRKLAERMVRGNYEQAALHKLYKSYVASGLGVELPPGQPAPIIGGKPGVKLPIEIRGTPWGATKQKNLWVRADLGNELRQAVQTDSRIQSEGFKRLLDVATTLQIAGPTDAAWHTINMVATVAGKQGGGGVLADAFRKVPPVNIIDAFTRVGANFVKSVLDTPEFQEQVAQIAKAGAMRGEAVHKGPLGAMSNWLINRIDKAGRVTLNGMYDELVNRGWAKDSELDRREFINGMGQYNERLMGRFKSLFREVGASPFVVAGTTMNRNAVQRLMLSPGVRAANPEAWVKLRAMNALGLVGTAIAVPMVLNSILTGKPLGRPGTPAGQIDTGKNDENGKPITVDPAQWDLTRRGLRITGADALSRGIQEGKGFKETTQAMAGDVFQGLLHPWAGPGVRGLYTAATGKDTSGYLVSRNPKNMTDNIIAALKTVNPTVASFFKEREAGKGGLASIVKPLEGAVGVKRGRNPGLEQRENEGAQAMFGKDWDKLSVPQRVKLQKSLDAQPKGEVDELAKRAGAERALWKGFQRQDDVKAVLAPEAQAFIQKHGLSLPAFEPEFTVNKTRVPLSRKETEAEQGFVVEEYNKRIAALAKNPNVGRWTPAQLQQHLDTLLTVAKKRARSQIKRGMNQASQAAVP